MRIIKPSEVVFADEKLETAFNKMSEKDKTKKQIISAIKEIKLNAFCGIQVPKRLIPREYLLKYKINNLWKYDLPDGWRLIYFVSPQNKVEILSIILNWLTHKEYERLFNY